MSTFNLFNGDPFIAGAGGGGGGGGGCFAKGTRILTPLGEIPIEELSVGDTVYCFDENGKGHESRILKTPVHEGFDIHRITIWGGFSIEVTLNHWAVNERGAFMEVGKFTRDNCFVDMIGDLRPFISSEFVRKDTVYNLIVDTYHTYIANGIRVHNGGGGGKGCFEAFTRIYTPEGEVPIVHLKEGDRVISYNQKGELSVNKVLRKMVHENNDIYRFKFWGGEVLVTPIHWFLTDENAFIEAQKFDWERCVVDLKERLRPFLGWEFVRRDTVYNLIIENDHTYIANGIRVHNGGGGGKGGGGGGGGGKEIQEAAESLRSNSLAKVIDLICEGEIEGPVDQNGNVVTGDQIPKSIYVDGIPLMDTSSGGLNFQSVILDYRNGTQDQTHIPNFPATENTQSVGTKMRYPSGGPVPVLFSISNSDVDEVDIAMRVPSLGKQDKKTGDIQGESVSYNVEVSYKGGAFVSAFSDTVAGKTSVAYIRQSTFTLPKSGDAPHFWTLRITRTTPDATSSSIQNELYFDYYTERVNAKFRYPNCVLFGVQVNAEQFSSIPSRAYQLKLLKVRIPTNYDPATRQYTGAWDGTFKVAWTDNPAWCFYDLLTNSRYGLGEYFPASYVDHIELYRIGQYCDELVPDGFGALEPRFTCNLYLQTREEAFKVITDMASIFRGMVYWGAGSLIPSQDYPKTPVKTFTNANVEEGIFSYTGSAKKARHTVAIVKFVDPKQNYISEIEYIEDIEGINRYGIREIEVSAFGCSSRGQAHRLGKWMLYTERTETDLCTFKTGMEGSYLRPGDVISVSDKWRAGVANGGRIIAISEDRKTIRVDRQVEIKSGVVYLLHVTNPVTNLLPREVTTSTQQPYIRSQQFVSRTLTNNPAIDALELNFEEALPSTVEQGMIWTLESSEYSAQLFRVLVCEEVDVHRYEIVGMEYNPAKFSEIEQGISFDSSPFSLLQGSVVSPVPPENLLASSRVEIFATGSRLVVDLSWTPSNNPIVGSYLVYYKRIGDNRVFYGETVTPSIVLRGLSAGQYLFEVQSFGRNGARSSSAEYTLTIGDANPALSPYITNLEILGQGNNHDYVGKDITFSWTMFSPTNGLDMDFTPGSPSPYTDPYFSSFSITIRDADTEEIVRAASSSYTEWTHTFSDNALEVGGPRRRYRIDVQVLDVFGNLSSEESIVVNNVSPSVPTGVTLGSSNSQINFNCTPSSNADFLGYAVWISPLSGFSPSLNSPTATSSSLPINIPIAEARVYYVRFAEYDTFGLVNLNMSPEYSVTGFIGSNPSAPSLPTGFSVSTFLQSNPDGTVSSKVRVTWNANPETDIAGYEVSLKPSGGSYTAFTTTGTSYEWTTVANVTYFLKLRAYNTSGLFSSYTSEQSIVSSQDTTPPAAPTGFVVNSLTRYLILEWQNPTDADFKTTEVWESSSNHRTTSALLTSTNGTTAFRSGLGLNATRYYWVRSKDSSGNYSTWNPASPTSGVVGTTQVLPVSDTAIETMQAKGASSGTISVSGGSTVNVTDFQLASPTSAAFTLNASTGEVTVNKAGNYLLLFKGSAKASSSTKTAVKWIWRLNGSDILGSEAYSDHTDNTSDGFSTANAQCFVTLALNDVVRVAATALTAGASLEKPSFELILIKL